jgi:hypothetical protein
MLQAMRTVFEDNFLMLGKYWHLFKASHKITGIADDR